jgi:GTP-binding protein HflX
VHDVGNKPREAAIVVSVVRKGTSPAVIQEHLDELELLLDTAGADVCARMYQERVRPDVATAIGSGKLAELKEILEETQATMVVFDDDLTPGQVRNLERETKVKVLDRCGVILDIFASRARSVEARTQVELAQHEYLLPRLTRMWTHLSKQYGGVGTRGPGETQIETDRRMFRQRIQRLKEKLSQVEMQRTVQRASREGLPRFALVGYTNAGKSSLLNTLAETDAYVEDRLFATLDTTVRAIQLPDGRRSLLSDTVGFIRKLPTQLVASFRSTLAETIEADVLLHVVDAANDGYRDHVDVVRQTLESLGASNIPTIMVFNKIDAINDRHRLHDIELEFPDAVFVSAIRGINVSRLLETMCHSFDDACNVLTLVVSYDDGRREHGIYAETNVIARSEEPDGVRLSVRVSSDKLSTFKARYADLLQPAS